MQQNVDNQAQEIGVTPLIQQSVPQPEPPVSTPLQSGWSLRRGSACNFDSVQLASLRCVCFDANTCTCDFLF